jgi:hypothetical protein
LFDQVIIVWKTSRKNLKGKLTIDKAVKMLYYFIVL